MKRVNGLFPVLTYQDSVVETEEIKNEILSTISKQVKENPYRVPIEWESKKLHTSYGRNNSLLQKVFKKYYKKYVSDFLDSSFISYVEIWFNHYASADYYQECHNHSIVKTKFDYSGVHFLSYNPEYHSPLRFYDPLRLVNSANEFTLDLPVNEGDILLFPSYLEHSVPQSINEYKTPRITVSFNIRL